MSYDFNGADRQSSGFDPIPAGTIVPLTMSIRPGGAGDGGWFKQSQSSDADAGLRIRRFRCVRQAEDLAVLIVPAAS
ncbi:MAG: hypothetical protein ACLSAH_05745 [Bilophila wadsworthia]